MTSVPGMRVTFRPSRQKEAWAGGFGGRRRPRGVSPAARSLGCWGQIPGLGAAAPPPLQSSQKQAEPRDWALEQECYLVKGGGHQPQRAELGGEAGNRVLLHPRNVSFLASPFRSFPGGSDVKGSACNLGDLCSIPGLGRSPGEGNGNPLQYSCLENPMDRGAWLATAHGVAKSWT